MARYANLKDYLQHEQIKLIEKAITEYQYSADISYGNLIIKSLRCTDDEHCNLTMELVVSVDHDFTDSKELFFKVTLFGNLDLMLQDIQVIDVKKCDKSDIRDDDLLNHFILPDVRSDDLERIGNELFSYYYIFADMKGYGLSLGKIISNMKAPIFFADLPADCLGRINLVEADIKTYRYDIETQQLKEVSSHAKPGIILLNKKKYYDEQDGELLITVAHELVHWQFHQKFFKLLVLLGTDSDEMNCKAFPIAFSDSMTDIDKSMCIAEWQANSLAMRLAIPSCTVDAVNEEIANNPSTFYENYGDRMQACVIKFAKIYGVSCFVAKARMRQLGYDFVDGTILEYEENEKKIQPAPFYFQPGTLANDETFVIYRDNFERLLRENEEFAEIINSGSYIYLGYAVCILDSKYADDKNGLTDYAREHADECLIKFRYKKIAKTSLIYSDHISSYLSKIPEFNKVEIEGFKICEVDRGLDKKINDDIEKYVDTINELKSRKFSTFSNTLVLHMRENNVDESILSYRTKIDVSLIRDYYKGNKQPSEENVMALCIGLKLHPDFCYDMFEKANYFIKADTPKHLAYRFLFKYTSKSIDTCNAILEKLGQKSVPKKNKKRVLNS